MLVTIKEAFGAEDIFLQDGSFDRLKMAQVIFSDETKREQMNGIVHPASPGIYLRSL